MRAAIVLAVVLVLSGLLTALSLRTPEPLPASSASDQFSAMRARADLDWLAAQAHPTGSPAPQKSSRYHRSCISQDPSETSSAYFEGNPQFP